jgi:hypothetical protein
MKEFHALALVLLAGAAVTPPPHPVVSLVVLVTVDQLRGGLLSADTSALAAAGLRVDSVARALAL